jgi:hypothetical protein
MSPTTSGGSFPPTWPPVSTSFSTITRNEPHRILRGHLVWIGLIHEPDQHHKVARAIYKKIGDAQIVTSEMVLTEVLNVFRKFGPRWRAICCGLCRSLARTGRDRRGRPDERLFPARPGEIPSAP